MADTLPINACLPDLLATLAHHSCAVLQAPPGSGKTTRVPLALLQASPDWLQGRRLLMLEPRRLAARHAARYMASLLGEPVGRRVGYRTRLDSQISADTRIEVVTEGILTRLLREDPALEAYGAVIFDEFHERSLQADLGLALVRESQQALRDDLRVLIMSATLDVEAVSTLLDDCPVLTSEGRSFPVDIVYRPPGRAPLTEHVATETRRLLQETHGSLLVFLPGEGEIRRVAGLLDGGLPPDTDLCPLYGQLDTTAQDRAISPSPAGRRKVVLATAIAETSLTIEGVRVVIDSGQARRAQFDPGTGMTRLVTQRLSQAAAEQRRGRAGRLEPGLCVRLWDHEEQGRLPPFATPDILLADLTDTVLALADWGVRDPGTLSWLDAPPMPAWQRAVSTLQALEALDDVGGLTPHGRQLLQLGLPPRLGQLVLRAREAGLPRLGAELASLLDERDLLPRGSGADLTLRLRAMREGGHGADRGRLQRVRESARRLARQGSGAGSADDIGLLLAQAWPEHIARRRPGPQARYQLANGRGASLADDDPLAASEWLVAAELDGDSREARIFLAAPLSRSDLQALPAHLLTTEDVVTWDGASEALRATRQRRLGRILIEEQPLPKPPQEVALPAFLAGLQRAGLVVLPWTEPLRQWQARVRLMHALAPQDWPDLSDAALLQTLADWASPWLGGLTRLAQLDGFPLAEALQALLDWPQRQLLDRLLPETLTVPTGSRIAIDYAAAFAGQPGPVLAVKLQELFGLDETPRLAEGRIPLTLHLLSPARRPVAVTADLHSFWRNAYAEVRKDLRGRYPRHPWPEDPLSAVAQKGVKHPRPR